MRIVIPIDLTADELQTLKRAARGRRVAKRLVERAQIVLRAAEGQRNKGSASELGISRPTVQLWRNRFAEKRIAGIEKDANRRGIPARQTHDYKRNGATTLCATLNAATRHVVAECMPRRRHQKFLRFLRKIDKETDPQLQMHMIVDNYCTHKNEKVLPVVETPRAIPHSFHSNTFFLVESR